MKVKHVINLVCISTIMASLSGNAASLSASGAARPSDVVRKELIPTIKQCLSNGLYTKTLSKEYNLISNNRANSGYQGAIHDFGYGVSTSDFEVFKSTQNYMTDNDALFTRCKLIVKKKYKKYVITYQKAITIAEVKEEKKRADEAKKKASEAKKKADREREIKLAPLKSALKKIKTEIKEIESAHIPLQNELNKILIKPQYVKGLKRNDNIVVANSDRYGHVRILDHSRKITDKLTSECIMDSGKTYTYTKDNGFDETIKEFIWVDCQKTNELIKQGKGKKLLEKIKKIKEESKAKIKVLDLRIAELESQINTL
ncbi:hypothetical protein FM038_013135 [Shewanella eurypsychrophilus]|uniref:Uncharacterized protein n=1 Tax=Shewanella eurypsychrophilus TaxID=2593656 RepID=A0ABX6V8H7_9GAMM|nr:MULTISPECIES: hypothetical protein [Shewanella]QFU22999.1 hypothetical protein FS418_14720 [Shewanella sp. YLB-09]QPG58285.1 hypothetical protein FM038_013135 [Shewanella eurypsychrophilus]